MVGRNGGIERHCGRICKAIRLHDVQRAMGKIQLAQHTVSGSIVRGERCVELKHPRGPVIADKQVSHRIRSNGERSYHAICGWKELTIGYRDLRDYERGGGVSCDSRRWIAQN